MKDLLTTTNDPMVYERVQINDRWYEVPKPIIARIAELEAINEGDLDQIHVLEAIIQRVRERCEVGLPGLRPILADDILRITGKEDG